MVDAAGSARGLEDFERLLLRSASDRSAGAPGRLYQAVRGLAAVDQLDDDFTLLLLTRAQPPTA